MKNNIPPVKDDRVIIINKGNIVADKKLSDLLTDQNQIIQVEFDLSVEKEFLNKIPHLKEAVNAIENHWSLVFETEKDMRAEVFDFAKQNRSTLLSVFIL